MDLSKHIKNYRYAEVLLMSGFSVIGLFFSANSFSELFSFRSIFFALTIFIFFISIYSSNSFFGYVYDLSNPRLVGPKYVKKKSYLLSFILTFFISLTFFYFLRPEFLFLALISFVLWFYYSFPVHGAKATPIAGTCVHFITQIIHFHIGYLLFSNYSWTSFGVSIYFGLLFSAGHLHHEVIDYEADKSKEIKTNAVFFGRRATFVASSFLFLASILLWIYLFSFAMIGITTFVPFLFAFLLQLLLIFPLLRIKNFNDASCSNNASDAMIIKYRNRYRLLYLLAGLLILVKYF